MSTVPDAIHVLHVDDEPDFADMAASFLEREDERLSIRTATSAEAGLERLGDDEFDCVISDYDMPGTTGIEFLRAVRDDYPDLPFILYTGKGSEEVASDAISAGVSDYLQKETGTDQYSVLANRITNLVSQYRAIATVEEYASHREESEQYRQQLLEIVSDTALSDPEKIDRLLALGRDRLGVENGHLVIIDEETDRHEVVRISGSEIVREGVTDLSTTYCRKTIQSDGILDVYRAGDQGWEGDPAYEAFGLECYIGGKLGMDDRLFGTLCFAGECSREPFTHNEKAFFELLRQWFTHMLDRRRRLNQAETIFEHTQDALFLIDVVDERTFTLQLVNRAYEELTGATAADVQGRTPQDLLSDDQAANVVTKYQECIEKREPIEYDERLTFGETTKWWHTRLAPVIEDDNIVQLAGATRDITSQTEREARLQALNETSQELMAASTPQQVAEIGVGAAREVLGLEANAVHLYDDERDGLVALAQTALSEELVGEAPTFTEGDSIAWRVYETGEAVAVDSVHDDPNILNPDSPVESELCIPIGDRGILLNASEEPEAFDTQDVVLGELLAGNMAAALEQIDRTAQVRIRERNLERQNERLDEFAGVLSHDLRNPLSVAQGRLELLAEECTSDHTEAIDRALTRIDELTQTLLQLARGSKRVHDTETVDLAELSETCWQNVESSDASLRADVERTVEADRSRLAQLLENLLRNAVEHGGDDVEIRIGDLSDGFFVADDGPGVPADERDAVFEWGYSTRKDGTGFGLSIVKTVAETHGWTITVTESAEGGARFELTGVSGSGTST